MTLSLFLSNKNDHVERMQLNSVNLLLEVCQSVHIVFRNKIEEYIKLNHLGDIFGVNLRN